MHSKLEQSNVKTKFGVRQLKLLTKALCTQHGSKTAYRMPTGTVIHWNDSIIKYSQSSALLVVFTTNV